MADVTTQSAPASPNTATAVAYAQRRTGLPWLALFLGGIVVLAAATISAGTLALGSLGAISVPGCGAGSACDQAANSIFGKIPLPESFADTLGKAAWPISYIGVAYFGALLAAWLMGRANVPIAMRWMLRFGAAGSLVLIGVMLIGGYLCKYCVGVHASNLLLLGLVEWGARGERARRGAATTAVFLVGFVAITAGLGIAAARARAAFVADSQTQLDDSVRKLQEKIERDRRRLAANANAAQPSDEPGKSSPSSRDSVPIHSQPDSIPINP